MLKASFGAIELLTDGKFFDYWLSGKEKKKIPHSIQPQLWTHTHERFCSYMEISSASLYKSSDFPPSLLNSLAVSVGPLNVTRLEFKNIYPGCFDLLQQQSS